MSHMIRCSEIFDKIYPRFEASLRRVVGRVIGYSNLSEQIMKCVMSAAISLHDIGKLTIEYQSGRTWMRHELPGFYILLEKDVIERLMKGIPSDITEALKKIVSISVYIMHEYFLARYERSWLRFPSARDLLWHMEKEGWSYRFIDDYPIIVEATLKIFGLDESLMEPLKSVAETGISYEQVIKAIVKASSISYGPNSPAIRLAVASVTKFIKDVDDEAAKIGRGVD